MTVLSNREKKFLANEKQMRKQFSAYATQASIMYEYCREFETEKEIFPRIQNMELKIKNGCIKKPSTRGWTDVYVRNSKQFGIININPFNLDSVHEFEYGVNYEKVPKNSGYARVRFFNSKNAKLSARNYGIKPQIKVISSSVNNANNQKVRAGGSNIRLDSLYDLMGYHRTVYHEMGHAMAKRTAKELNSVIATKMSGVNSLSQSGRQVVCFSGKNPLWGYEVDKKGKIGKMLWRNAGMQYLEEGVVENIAMDCLENEIILSENTEFRRVDKMQFLDKMRNGVTYYSAYALVGLWNSVSDNELLKQHFGNETTDKAVAESTEKFKELFANYVHSVVGNVYNGRTKGIFADKKVQKIVDNYAKCVDFCKSQFSQNLLSGKAEQSMVRNFTNKLDLAQNLENVSTNLNKYIDMNLREKEILKNGLSNAMGLSVYQNNNLEFAQNNLGQGDEMINTSATKNSTSNSVESVIKQNKENFDDKEITKDSQMLR